MLRIEGLSHSYSTESSDRLLALKEIDLDIPTGQFATVIGSNGAGKTSLFDAISGRFAPTLGKIFVEDMDITLWPEYRRSRFIGRIFQNPMHGTASGGTIAQNLVLAELRGRKHRLRAGVTKNRIDRYQQMVGELGLDLEERLNSTASTLSGGQRQAITLLMSLLSEIKVLLIDEHTASLDPHTAEVVLNLTDRLIKKKALTTLMITHNIDEALRYGDRTIMMDRGRIVLDITERERSNYTVSEIVDLFRKRKEDKIEDDDVILDL